MARFSTTIRYDGPALSTHEMDVQDLAPALLALTDIIQRVNKISNGDDIGIKVLVNADKEQKCFQIDLHLVQTIYDHAKQIFGHIDHKSAQDIAELIGIGLTSTLGIKTPNFFQTLIDLFGKDTEEGNGPQVSQQSGGVTVIVNGDGNTVQVPQSLAPLFQDPLIIANAKTVLSPLKKPGYETLSFEQDEEPVFEIGSRAAIHIINADIVPIAPELTPSTLTMRGLVRIKSPQYEGNAQWVVSLNGVTVFATVLDKDWLIKFQNNLIEAPPNSLLNVEIIEHAMLDLNGDRSGTPKYVITKVINVVLPHRPTIQGELDNL